MATEKERERGREDIKKLFNYLENCCVKGLEDILIEIKDFSSSGRYNSLIESCDAEMRVKRDRTFTLDELLQIRVLKLARDNLRFGGILTSIFTGTIVTAKQFGSIFAFIEYTYAIFAGKPTNWDDGLNIYFSGLDERIIFALDKFDEVKLNDLPEPTQEYFQMLRRVKWKDKKAKKTYDKLTELMMEISKFVLDYPDLSQRVGELSKYWSTEDLFIETIAGCSAVNEDRLEIEAEDVVKAYKTFFKLIKTDVTKYKAIPELAQNIKGYKGPIKNKGYLVCQKCGGYYKLEANESPDDFSDTCECGGKLLFRVSLQKK